jgi:hypothetical protein
VFKLLIFLTSIDLLKLFHGDTVQCACVVSMPDVAMIAMSWVTDETSDTLKCLNMLRKLLSFTANLCAVEEMPVLIGCSLRLSLDDIKQVFHHFFPYMK